MRGRRVLPLLALLPVLLAAGCGGGGDSSSAGCTEVTAPTPGFRNAPQPTAPLDLSKTYEVTMETNCGSFTIELDPNQSPNAAASFFSLAGRGFYDATTFHRIAGNLIQGGDPSGSGTEGPGYTTVDPPPTDAGYRHGTVAMAKTGGDPPGTGGSQFFIVTAVDAGFAPDYAVVGHVIEGLDVVDEIGRLGGDNELPTQVVEIEKATAEAS